MSQFSNRATGDGAGTAGYVSAVLGLLGDRDPLEVLGSTADAIRSLIVGLSQETLSKPEDAGKWSLIEVLQHLADSEIVWAYRVRRVLAEDRPVLEGYDQDLWAKRLGYSHAAVNESLAVFSACRTSNLRVLRGLDPADLQRVGVHEERGEESVRHMIALYAGHDLVHLAQMRRIIERHRSD